jgi:hypothetical protein
MRDDNLSRRPADKNAMGAAMIIALAAIAVLIGLFVLVPRQGQQTSNHSSPPTTVGSNANPGSNPSSSTTGAANR